jgi:peptidase E
MTLLLTSAGFQNQAVAEAFVGLLDRSAGQTKVLFIPTAAQSEETLFYVDKAKKNLQAAGIVRNNIHIYDLDRSMDGEELGGYGAVFVCGGDIRYLLRKVKRAKFDRILASYTGVYVGVSAGSLITAALMDIGRTKMVKGLGIVSCGLCVHCQKGSQQGKIDMSGCPVIALTDRQALVVKDDTVTLIQ